MGKGLERRKGKGINKKEGKGMERRNKVKNGNRDWSK
jgi:hypothetical protein